MLGILVSSHSILLQLPRLRGHRGRLVHLAHLVPGRPGFEPIFLYRLWGEPPVQRQSFVLQVSWYHISFDRTLTHESTDASSIEGSIPGPRYIRSCAVCNRPIHSGSTPVVCMSILHI
jgi:hypothetical protein